MKGPLAIGFPFFGLTIPLSQTWLKSAPCSACCGRIELDHWSFQPANGVLYVNVTVFALIFFADAIWSQPFRETMSNFGLTNTFQVKMKSSAVSGALSLHLAPGTMWNVIANFGFV